MPKPQQPSRTPPTLAPASGAKPLAPHVRNAIAGVQAKPAPAGRPVAAHVAAAIQAKPAPAAARPPAALAARPAAVPAISRPAAHLAAAIQSKPRPVQPLRPAPPLRPTVPAGPPVLPRPGVLQRMEQQDPPENKRAHLKRKASRGSVTVDPFAYMDNPNYGKNQNYETERREFDQHQRKKFKKWRKSLGSGELKTIPHFTSGNNSNLQILSLEQLDKGFESLKGNTESSSYAVPIKVGSTPFYFKTSYNMDVGFAPLDLKDDCFHAGTCRPFSAIAPDLDDFIGSNKTRRAEVGRLIMNARDEVDDDWKKKPKDRETLESLIAELGVIFRLDLMRAGSECKELARSHQDALLGSKITFQKLLLKEYIGIKAARLRDSEEYENSDY